MADIHRREETFKVGDNVYLKLQPYRQRTLATRPNEKLSPRFFGPYSIIKKIGKLKRHVGAAAVTTTIPPQLSPDLEFIMEPELLLGIREGQGQGTDVKKEVLIQWHGLPAVEATWEDSELIAQRFPEFHLEDKYSISEVLGFFVEQGQQFVVKVGEGYGPWLEYLGFGLHFGW
ncbi:uncharacterized protein LOC141695734 [Apium graveolens]|uniref:uncharacterized protein LOC141695734 n=1 Tax=Apium graveolens TaxID=4045 RepID=UPI003D7ADBC7